MKPSQSQSESRRGQSVKEQQSWRRKQAMSWTPWGGSPHNSSHPWDWKLPTLPQPSWDKTAEEPKAQQTAFKEAMELSHSSSMNWEDQVQKEEEWQRCCSIMEGSPSLGLLPLPLEGDNISDISMVNDSLLQHDSDVVIEEEREESMETDVPLDSAAPMPLKEKAMSEDFEARDPDDHCSHMSEESTDQNPPHNSNPDEDELLGLVTNISVPGGHSDDSVALIVSLGEDDLWTINVSCNCKTVDSKNQQDTWVEMDRIRFIWTHIPSLT